MSNTKNIKNINIVKDTADEIFRLVSDIIKDWDDRGMPVEYSVRSIRSLRDAWKEMLK